jgi:glutamate racemase
MSGDLHLVVTDSGLGGLSICAEIERNLRLAGTARPTRLTYVNAWPREGSGYNDIPDQATRTQVFDRALAAIDELHADRILIACNTLSIFYPLTEHCRIGATPVQGIVEAGVDLFWEALTGTPGSALVVLGTRATVASAAHRDGLIARGVEPRRIGSVDCHGLAGAIEANPRGAVAAHLIEKYAS